MFLKLALMALLLAVISLWWQRKKAGTGPNGQGPNGMSLNQAYAILGLDPGCNADDIRRTHRRLISAVHPDRGGSNYLASQLNQARDLLLAKHLN